MSAIVYTLPKIETKISHHLADINTPVSIYLKVRDKYRESILLESTDSRSVENCFSFIALDPLVRFRAQNGEVIINNYVTEEHQTVKVDNSEVLDHLKKFVAAFKVEDTKESMNGVFGHTSFEAVQYFDTIHFPTEKRKTDLPDIHYVFYRFIISINHFKDELTILENIPEGETSRMSMLENYLNAQNISVFKFQTVSAETSNLTDETYLEHIAACKNYCQIGDVFQIVPSRRYYQTFEGDDFQVYRALRNINPSPYLFYFDYGLYKIFGSSPEQQIVAKDGKVTVNPIAGTYKRTGDDAQDAQLAIDLAQDPKENAEHIMLVDLARNDLSKHCDDVRVKVLKEIQYFSHVIHIVSKVEGTLKPGTNVLDIYADTFPAGTLSGAPKYKAIELIRDLEPENRHFYGGGIGFISFKNDITHAIVIRSFLSKDNILIRQAGCGVVVSSDNDSELQEVHNKLGALKKALVAAVSY